MSLKQSWSLIFVLAIILLSSENIAMENLATNVLTYSKYLNTNRIIELFLNFEEDKIIKSVDINQILKAFMSRGFYCNLNPICRFSDNNLEVRLSEIKNNHNWKTMILVDGSSIKSQTFLKLASQLNMFDNHLYWIIVVKSLSQYKIILDVLDTLNISISSKITLYWDRMDSAEVTLYDVW